MLLFTITGVTLNHAEDISAEPIVISKTLQLPAEQLSHISYNGEDDKKAPLPAELHQWIANQLETRFKKGNAEWSEYEIYLSLPRPGGDAWLAINRETGELTYESTSRGTISFLNDLHKGRHTGTAWVWFIDIFSFACIIFCLTGLGLLFVHAKRRPSTWPVVIAGLVIPFILILSIIFIH